MIRTFIAAELSGQLRTRLARTIDAMRVHAPLVKWSNPENLHLTFKFLGDVKESRLDELFTSLREAVEPLSPFTLEVRGLGAFPHWRHPRVVWAGCHGDGEDGTDAMELAAAVEDCCVSLGFEEERRPFRPHLTLGRVRYPADAHGLGGVAKELEGEFFGFLEVDAVAVFMSTLRRTGPVYSPMARLELLG